MTKRKVWIAIKAGLLLIFVWFLWQIRLPQEIITRFFPVETYYSVRAEIELDGELHVLEAVGSCDWQWRTALPLVFYNPGILSFRGGFLTKVLSDGRAIVIFPGKHCIPRADKSEGAPPGSYWRSSRLFNERGLFFYTIDLVTGDIKYPEGAKHDDYYVRRDVLPEILVLAGASDPKTITYFPNPQEHMALDCARLRVRSYRVTNTSSGKITRHELDIPYLVNLPKTGTAWVGVTARVIPFSTFDKVPWLREQLDALPPLTRLFDVVELPRNSSMNDWRRPATDRQTWERNVPNPEDRWVLRDKASGQKAYWHELDFHQPPAQDVVWDRDGGTLLIPLKMTGPCPAMVTLYPTSRAHKDIFLVAGDARGYVGGRYDLNFHVVSTTQELIAAQSYRVGFNPWEFENQP